MKKSFKLTTIALIIFAAIASVAAQEKEEYSKWELYGGYSSLRSEKTDVGNQSIPPIGKNAERKGFEFSATRNLNRYFGLKFDYGRNANSETFSLPAPFNLAIKNNANSNLFAGGVQIKDNASKTRIKPFVHALFGVMAVTGKNQLLVCPVGQPNCSETAKGKSFAMVFGGGVDIKVNKRISIRPIQVDYIRLNKSIESVNAGTPNTIERSNYRIGAGVVFHADQTDVETKPSTKKFSRWEAHVGYIFNKFQTIDLQPITSIKLKSMNGYNASIKWNFPTLFRCGI